jgi:hypothetical protein
MATGATGTYIWPTGYQMSVSSGNIPQITSLYLFYDIDSTWKFQGYISYSAGTFSNLSVSIYYAYI